ncbi:hypothetical protein [Flavobacterium silvaticum]|uniref:Uncharacterized protein n=1 Tax=Flavobacterium silvaticum TaxID=1852020 RepID=A0A972FNL0_9FLAO|nr:hypothetical protein [Flavobacterium silvaticum]NMH26539.1 hypothetical protein [Flavobacterium silvaticum]
MAKAKRKELAVLKHLFFLNAFHHNFLHADFMRAGREQPSGKLKHSGSRTGKSGEKLSGAAKRLSFFQ